MNEFDEIMDAFESTMDEFEDAYEAYESEMNTFGTLMESSAGGVSSPETATGGVVPAGAD